MKRLLLLNRTTLFGSTSLQTSYRENLLNSVANRKLKKVISLMYRQNASVGTGSTADAIKFEIKSGQMLSPSGHMQKGIDMRTALGKIAASSKLSTADFNVAKSLRIDLQDALSEERTHSKIFRRP